MSSVLDLKNKLKLNMQNETQDFEKPVPKLISHKIPNTEQNVRLTGASNRTWTTINQGHHLPKLFLSPMTIPSPFSHPSLIIPFPNYRVSVTHGRSEKKFVPRTHNGASGKIDRLAKGISKKPLMVFQCTGVQEKYWYVPHFPNFPTSFSAPSPPLPPLKPPSFLLCRPSRFIFILFHFILFEGFDCLAVNVIAAYSRTHKNYFRSIGTTFRRKYIYMLFSLSHLKKFNFNERYFVYYLVISFHFCITFTTGRTHPSFKFFFCKIFNQHYLSML